MCPLTFQEQGQGIDNALAAAVVRLDAVSELRCQSRDADYTVAAKPHRAVRLVMKKELNALLLDTLRLPRAFPREKPIGCARRPVLPGEVLRVGASLPECRKQRVECVSCDYEKVVEAVELELGGVCDLSGHAHRGRGKGASIVARPSVPRRAAGSRGAMAQDEYANVRGGNRLKELLAFCEIHRKHGRHSAGQ